MGKGIERPGGQRFRAAKVIASVLTCMCLAGCGQSVLAGTAVVAENDPVVAQSSGDVSWYDGIEMRTARVNIGPVMPVENLEQINTEKVPLTDVSQIRCFQISSLDNIKGLYDMQVYDKNHDLIRHVGTVYDGCVYELGNGWYGFVIPNSYKVQQ